MSEWMNEWNKIYMELANKKKSKYSFAAAKEKFFDGRPLTL